MTVTFRSRLLPTRTSPNASVVGAAVTIGATPRHDSATVGLPPSLATARVPVSAPRAVGAHRTVTIAAPPAAIVVGAAVTRLNPVPVTVAPVTIAGASPLLVTVTFRSRLLPTRTSPNANVVGAAVTIGAPAEVHHSGTRSSPTEVVGTINIADRSPPPPPGVQRIDTVAAPPTGTENVRPQLVPLVHAPLA